MPSAKLTENGIEGFEHISGPNSIVELGEGFETSGKIGFEDIIHEIMENLERSDLYVGIKAFFESLPQRVNEMSSTSKAVTVLIGVYVIFSLIYSGASSNDKSETDIKKDEKEIEVVPQRDFTIDQLRDYDGTDKKPIYIALNREVFDVSAAVEFYGEGSGYHCFAGREASRAMAKLSFDEIELSNPNIDDLGPFEKSTLDEWYQKFKVSVPPHDLKFTHEGISKFKGDGEIPEGRIHSPCYVSLNGKVFDVSFGGMEMYGVGGPYHIFAGIDASRALAKMSFKPEDVNSHDLSDLTTEQLKTLTDWEVKFQNSRKYPVVGTLTS